MSLSASTRHVSVSGLLPSGPDPLSQEQWSALWEADSVLCRWLATLFGGEISAEVLEQYRRGDASPMLAMLAGEYGLAEEVQRLESSLAGLVMFPMPHLELAADFAELFLVDALSGAAPYASLHGGEARVFHGEPAARMEQRLGEAGFAVTRDFPEPPDHLAVMLEYLAYRCEALATLAESERAAGCQAIRHYLEEELCNWLPAFAARCRRVSTASDFYPALAALTAAYSRQLARNVASLLVPPASQPVD